MAKIQRAQPYDTAFSDFLGYKMFKTELIAVPENYIDLSDPYYYDLTDFDPQLIEESKIAGVELPKAGNGQYDAVRALYT